MSEQTPLDGADRELEAALGGLAPREAAIRRDRLMFEAGRTAGRMGERRKMRMWKVTTAILAMALGGALAPRTQTRSGQYARQTAPEREGAAGPAPAEARPVAMPARGDGSYLALRDAVLGRGLSGILAPPAGRGRVDPRWSRQLLDLRPDEVERGRIFLFGLDDDANGGRS